MSEETPKFTPLPWECSPYGSYLWHIRGGITKYEDGSSYAAIADVHGNEMCQETSKANAQLIAAAPALYTALTGFIREHKQNEEHICMCDCCISARAAVALAEGKTPMDAGIGNVSPGQPKG